MATRKVVLTEATLDKAIEAVEKLPRVGDNYVGKTQVCILNQAIREAFPEFTDIEVGYSSFFSTEIGSSSWSWRITDAKQKASLEHVVLTFDDLKYEEVRGLLPMEVDFVS